MGLNVIVKSAYWNFRSKFFLLLSSLLVYCREDKFAAVVNKSIILEKVNYCTAPCEL